MFNRRTDDRGWPSTCEHRPEFCLTYRREVVDKGKVVKLTPADRSTVSGKRMIRANVTRPKLTKPGMPPS